MREVSDILSRFLSKVEKSSGCWEWTGQRSPNGYGRFRLQGRLLGAHRVAYMLLVGDDPGHLYVCHTCDNPGCVNPEHLFLGSQKDNIADMNKKGRGNKPRLRGETNRQAKLTTEEVREIRSSHEKGVDLAKRFGVSPSNISAIRLGRSWGHV